jgi:hypothetical protein
MAGADYRGKHVSNSITRAARERQKTTGEKYTVARRAIIAERELLRAQQAQDQEVTAEEVGDELARPANGEN